MTTTGQSCIDAASDCISRASAPAWFANSKVIDSIGRPLVVFHGTTKCFDTFCPETLGSASRHPTAKAGFFFSADPAVAGLFAGEGWTDWPLRLTYAAGANVRPAILVIRRPYVIAARDYLLRFVRGDESFPAFAVKLQRSGLDGICIAGDARVGEEFGGDEYGADAWVAFSPGQIETAWSASVREPSWPARPEAADETHGAAQPTGAPERACR